MRHYYYFLFALTICTQSYGAAQKKIIVFDIAAVIEVSQVTMGGKIFKAGLVRVSWSPTKDLFNALDTIHPEKRQTTVLSPDNLLIPNVMCDLFKGVTTDEAINTLLATNGKVDPKIKKTVELIFRATDLRDCTDFQVGVQKQLAELSSAAEKKNVYLVGNWDPYSFTLIKDKLSLSSYFPDENIYISGTTKTLLPDMSALIRVATKAGVARSEIIFISSMQNHISAAQAAGFSTYSINRIRNFPKQLRDVITYSDPGAPQRSISLVPPSSSSPKPASSSESSSSSSSTPAPTTPSVVETPALSPTTPLVEGSPASPSITSLLTTPLLPAASMTGEHAPEPTTPPSLAALKEPTFRKPTLASHRRRKSYKTLPQLTRITAEAAAENLTPTETVVLTPLPLLSAPTEAPPSSPLIDAQTPSDNPQPPTDSNVQAVPEALASELATPHAPLTSQAPTVATNSSPDPHTSTTHHNKQPEPTINATAMPLYANVIAAALGIATASCLYLLLFNKKQTKSLTRTTVASNGAACVVGSLATFVCVRAVMQKRLQKQRTRTLSQGA